MKKLLVTLIIIVAAAGLLIVVAPIAITIVIAFSADSVIRFPPSGFSLRWFDAFLTNNNLRNAFVLSLYLAVAAASCATVLATAAALGVAQLRKTSNSLFQVLFMAPLVFPNIVLGLALLIYFKQIGVPVFAGLLLAHIVITIPYVFRLVATQISTLDLSLHEASQSLRAGPFLTFRRVTLPLILPGLMAGWIFAFIISLGELNTALFLTSPRVKTLPIELFGYLLFEGEQLVVAAASALQIAVIILAMLAIEFTTGLSGRRSTDSAKPANPSAK